MEKDTKNIHRGELLYRYATNYPGSIKDMVVRTRYKYGTFFKHIDKADLSFSILAEYGKAMNVDFSKEFPEMANMLFFDLPKNDSREPSNEQLKAENIELQGKLTKLHEKYTQVLEENYQLKDENRLLREGNANR